MEGRRLVPENIYSAACHKCSDIITLAAQTGNTGQWVAIRMNDGGWDGTLYETRRDAVKHQFYEQFCCYVKVPPGGMTAKEADAFLSYHRALYDAGFRLPDPEFQPPLMPLRKEDQVAQINALTKKRSN
jgi:hypothetical protein